jgi:hypothetical protein
MRAGGILFGYRTSRMPATEYTFPGKQLPRALGISFVPSLIAGQPSQQRITRICGSCQQLKLLSVPRAEGVHAGRR